MSSLVCIESLFLIDLKRHCLAVTCGFCCLPRLAPAASIKHLSEVVRSIISLNTFNPARHFVYAICPIPGRWLSCVYRRQANSYSSRLLLRLISNLIMRDCTEHCVLIDFAAWCHNHFVLQSRQDVPYLERRWHRCWCRIACWNG